MQGLNEFLDLFGHITISEVIVVLLALGFLIAIYRKISDYLMKKHDAAQEKNAQIMEALEAAKQYPVYRQQSIDIQKHFEDEIKELRTGLSEALARLTKIEAQNKKKECNKLRDILLERYRYYTNKECNPTQSWTTMESYAFWELFRDYEDAGGNDFMHTIVQPAMEKLELIEVHSTIQN